MKVFLLYLLSVVFISSAHAQTGSVSSLPSGKYITVIPENQAHWDMGDIILLEDNKYKLTTSEEVGDFKFSYVAQRLFFTSGPLKNVYARILLTDNNPSILIPRNENEQKGLKLVTADVMGVYRH